MCDDKLVIKKKFLKHIVFSLLVVITLIFSVRASLAAVTLLYFNASGLIDRVLLEWETATEINNSGFYIQRSIQQDSGFDRISGFIVSEGDPYIGSYYSYEDLMVEAGVMYYYKLEIIDAGGNSTYSDITPPVSIGNNSTATATLTSTGDVSTATSTTTADTQTPTATQIKVSPTSSVTPSITSTKTPKKTSTRTLTSTPTIKRTATNTWPPTATFTPTGPTRTPTSTNTSTPTPTTTLMPLPAITILFPIPTVTTTPSITLSLTVTPTSLVEANQPSTISMRLKLLIAVVLLLWVILAGFIIFYVRRLSR
jgi:hypothetical protein